MLDPNIPIGYNEDGEEIGCCRSAEEIDYDYAEEMRIRSDMQDQMTN